MAAVIVWDQNKHACIASCKQGLETSHVHAGLSKIRLTAGTNQASLACCPVTVVVTAEPHYFACKHRLPRSDLDSQAAFIKDKC